MATYPAHGTPDWDDDLKAYIDQAIAAATSGGDSGGSVSPSQVDPHLPWIEGVPAWVEGHSYYQAGGDGNTNFAAPHRVQRRLHHQIGIDQASAGNNVNQVLATAKGFPANSVALVYLCCLVNNSNNGISAVTTREQMRSLFAQFTAVAKIAASDSAFAYGSGWSSGATSTAGSYVDFGWTGDAAYVSVECGTGSATSVSVTNSGSGSAAQTINTGGYTVGFTGVIRLKGYGAGPHTVRIKLDSGAGLTISGAVIPSPTPPTIAWFREGPLPSYTTEQNALLASYRDAIEPVLADFPTVVKIQWDNRYDAALHMGTDGVHPNARGQEYMATLHVEALANLTWRQGQNNLLNSSVVSNTPAGPAYVGATPNFSGGAATVPGVPQSLAATPASGQVALTWSAPPTNGGATISDYLVQYRVTSVGGSWTTFSDATSATTGATVTGLTNATGYDFRVAAVNSVGTGTYTSVVAATPTAGGGSGGGTTYSNVVQWSDGNWLYVDVDPSDPSAFPSTIKAFDKVTILSGTGWSTGASYTDVNINGVGVFGVGPGGAARRLIDLGGASSPAAPGTGGGVVSITVT